MARPDQPRTVRAKQEEEVDRYRTAAEDALEQLDWAIAYLHGIQRFKVAQALARNRAEIGRQVIEPD